MYFSDINSIQYKQKSLQQRLQEIIISTEDKMTDEQALTCTGTVVKM